MKLIRIIYSYGIAFFYTMYGCFLATLIFLVDNQFINKFRSIIFLICLSFICVGCFILVKGIEKKYNVIVTIDDDNE